MYRTLTAEECRYLNTYYSMMHIKNVVDFARLYLTPMEVDDLRFRLRCTVKNEEEVTPAEVQKLSPLVIDALAKAELPYVES